MKVGVFGTGDVGKTVASHLISHGHEVMMGSRSADHDGAVSWAAEAGELASQGTFADAADFGEVLFNCTAGMHSLKALGSAGREALGDKLLIDLANPLDFSKGMPPTLSISNHDSLAEQIQKTYPQLKVVKALNTVTAALMVNPSLLPEDHHLLMCGDDADAKAQATSILKETFHWDQVLDLGGIDAARGMEGYLLLWIRLWGALGTPLFNIRLVKAEPQAD